MNRTSIDDLRNMIKTHDYSAKETKPKFNEYLKTVKKSSRRKDSPSTEVINIYRSDSCESKEGNSQNIDLSSILNKNADIKFQNIQMFYVPKASKNSFIDSEVECEDKSMTKIEKINKQKIKDLKSQYDCLISELESNQSLMLSKTNKLEQLKSQINFLYNSLYSTTDKINSIYEDIKIDQKIIESSVNTYSICKDKVVYEFIQQRIKHINRQVMLENEYINIKLRCEIDYINQTKQSRFIQLMSRCFDDIYNLFRMNSFDQYKSSSAKDYNSGDGIQEDVESLK